MENHFEAKESLYEKGMQRLKQAEYIVQSKYRTDNFRAAAELFEEAGDYQDAREQAERCRILAEKSQADGVEERYRNAVEAEDRIIDQSDADHLVEAFHELDGYKDSAAHQEKCRKIADQFTVRAHRKRNLILAILAAVVIVCAYGIYAGMWGYVKGRLYGAAGYYEKAIEAFEEMGDFLDSEKQLEIYREKQLRSREAQERSTLTSLKAGKETRYGEFTWTVLEASDGELLLIPKSIEDDGPLYHIPFDEENRADWEVSSLCRYLNGAFLTEYFTEEEQGRITGSVEIPDEAMLEQYGEQLKSLKTDVWVNAPGEQDGTECYLTGGGSLMTWGCPTGSDQISVCPVLHINLEDLNG